MSAFVPRRAGVSSREAVLGWVALVAAVTIWAGWAVATRLLFLEASLGTADIVALRFLVAAGLMAPHALKRGRALWRVEPVALAGVVLGSGFAFSLCNTGGLAFAPAAHGGAMTSPLGAVFTGFLAWGLIGEPLPRRRLVGLALIAAGAAAIVLASLDGLWGPRAWIGHLLFTAAGFLWAAYTVAVRGARVGVLDAVTLSVVGSALAFTLPYLLLVGPRFLAAPPWEVAVQGLLHGALGATLSVILFNRGLVLVGATRAAAVGALTPTLTALFGIIVLGEVPSPIEAIGIAVLTLGVVLASALPPAQAPPLAPAPPRP